MSLINQMLKDLEARSIQPTPGEATLTGLQATARQEKKKRRKYVLMLGFLAFILIWAWNINHYYRNHPRYEKPALAQVSPGAETVPPKTIAKASVSETPLPAVAPLALPLPPPPALPKNSLIEEEKVVPVALTGISMQVHGKLTYLRFLLSQDAFYQVNSDPYQHRLIISLKNTHSTVNIPPLDYQNSAISELKVVQEGKEGLKIYLLLKPEAKLSNLELNKESKYPELQADFLVEMMPQAALKPEESSPKQLSEPEPGTLNKVAHALSTEEQYQEAINFAENGEKDKAIQQLSSLLQQVPDYKVAREALISLFMQQGNQERAEELLMTGLELEPFHPPFIEFKAHLLVDQGKINQALHLLKKAPPALAEHPEYYAFMAALYQRVGQLPAAENLYQQLTALHPEKGVWWLGLGVTQEGLGKNSQALEAYAKADKSPDLDPELRGYVGTRLRG
jgi:tetratricopeptide (TPR) repeat protein